jgi:hypothetical protein
VPPAATRTWEALEGFNPPKVQAELTVNAHEQDAVSYPSLISTPTTFAPTKLLVGLNTPVLMFPLEELLSTKFETLLELTLH